MDNMCAKRIRALIVTIQDVRSELTHDLSNADITWCRDQLNEAIVRDNNACRESPPFTPGYEEFEKLQASVAVESFKQHPEYPSQTTVDMCYGFGVGARWARSLYQETPQTAPDERGKETLPCPLCAPGFLHRFDNYYCPTCNHSYIPPREVDRMNDLAQSVKPNQDAAPVSLSTESGNKND